MTAPEQRDTDAFYEFLDELSTRIGGPQNSKTAPPLQAGPGTVSISSLRMESFELTAHRVLFGLGPTQLRLQVALRCGIDFPTTEAILADPTQVAETTVGVFFESTWEPPF